MNKIIRFFTVLFAIAMFSHAGVPMQNMSSNGIALDYSGLWRGATITAREVGAHENVQMINLHYTPVPWLLLSAGLGAASYSVDTITIDATHKTFYNGRFGFAPSFGVDACTPYLLQKILRVTVGAKGYYLNTSDKTEQYGYSGLFATGSAGLIFSIGSAVDIELGGRGFVIMGEMQGKTDSVYGFSNNEKMRGYLSVTLQTPLEGGYISLDFDASPNISGGWSKGPAESSIGISAGMIFHSRTFEEKSKILDDKNFPNYKETEKKVETLKKELK